MPFISATLDDDDTKAPPATFWAGIRDIKLCAYIADPAGGLSATDVQERVSHFLNPIEVIADDHEQESEGFELVIGREGVS